MSHLRMNKESDFNYDSPTQPFDQERMHWKRGGEEIVKRFTHRVQGPLYPLASQSLEKSTPAIPWSSSREMLKDVSKAAGKPKIVGEETFTPMLLRDILGAQMERSGLWAQLVDGRRVHLVEVMGRVFETNQIAGKSIFWLSELKDEPAKRDPIIVQIVVQGFEGYRTVPKKSTVIRCVGHITTSESLMIRGSSVNLIDCFCWQSVSQVDSIQHHFNLVDLMKKTFNQ